MRPVPKKSHAASQLPCCWTTLDPVDCSHLIRKLIVKLFVHYHTDMVRVSPLHNHPNTHGVEDPVTNVIFQSPHELTLQSQEGGYVGLGQSRHSFTLYVIHTVRVVKKQVSAILRTARSFVIRIV